MTIVIRTHTGQILSQFLASEDMPLPQAGDFIMFEGEDKKVMQAEVEARAFSYLSATGPNSMRGLEVTLGVRSLTAAV